MFDTKTDPKLAGVIEEARTRAGLTKYRLAVRSGLSLQTVRAACQGIATTRTLNSIAKALGVSVDSLKGRDSSIAIDSTPATTQAVVLDIREGVMPALISERLAMALSKTPREVADAFRERWPALVAKGPAGQVLSLLLSGGVSVALAIGKLSLHGRASGVLVVVLQDEADFIPEAVHRFQVELTKRAGVLQ